MSNRGIIGGGVVDGVDWTLPAVVSAHGNGTNNIAATTFAVLPSTTVSASMTNPHPRARLLVVVDYGAWLLGAASTDVRACLNVSGSLTVTPGIGGGGPVGWGEVLYASATTGQGQHSAMCTYLLPVSGTAATFALYAEKTGAGTPQCNYGTIMITPIRYVWS
jgi:hypothetical protein